MSTHRSLSFYNFLLIAVAFKGNSPEQTKIHQSCLSIQDHLPFKSKAKPLSPVRSYHWLGFPPVDLETVPNCP